MATCLSGRRDTALSRTKQWEDVDIIELCIEAFKVDSDAVKEYERLHSVHDAIVNRTMLR